MRRRTIAITLALSALVPLAAAPAAPAKSAKKPSVKRVSPMRAHVGDTIKIRGKQFSSRRRRNTVIFRGANGRTVFAKPRRASRGRLVVRVPKAIKRIAGGKQIRRYKLRVLSGRKFSKWTPKRLSPVIITNPADPSTCEDGDQLPLSLEQKIGTDPCDADTDHDSIQDGFEYQSARDLNDDEDQDPNSYLPYPGKRPYPNPLDSSDVNTDFDGDGLLMWQEQKLWKFSGEHGLYPLSYSEGEQYSMSARGANGRRYPTLKASAYSKQTDFVNWTSANGYRKVMLTNGAPWYSSTNQKLYGLFDANRNGFETTAEVYYNDRNGDGYLSDDERDEDADGLPNLIESGEEMRPEFWSGCYSMETPFPVKYAGTDLDDPDSDGDGIRDGADDQDHDDIPNIMELSRFAASGLYDGEPGLLDCNLAKSVKDALEGEEPPLLWHSNAFGRVNPFNPCLPATWSRTCPKHFAFGSVPAPFDKSPNWYSLN